MEQSPEKNNGVFIWYWSLLESLAASFTVFLLSFTRNTYKEIGVHWEWLNKSSQIIEKILYFDHMHMFATVLFFLVLLHGLDL